MAKKKVTFTIQKATLDTFKSLAEINSLNMSRWIENQMVKYIEKEVL